MTTAWWPTGAAYSQTKCIDENNNQADLTKEVRNVEAWVSDNKRRTSELQLLLFRSYPPYAGKIDGVVGAQTRQVLCEVMKTYIAIGGSGPDWGVNQPKDADRFIEWLYAALIATETGGEFPD
jgi:hypothetical protein